MRRFLYLICFIMLAPSAVCADIYQFTDENGVVHFTNVQTTGAVRVMKEKPAAPPSSSSDATSASTGGERISQGGIRSIVEKKAERYSLDPLLLMEVIRAESDFDPYAVSPKGARGLMQLMPGTAARLGVQDSFDPEQNIDGGTRYLRYLLDYFNGSVPLALAAYNAGESAVNRWQSIPPYKETQHYVKKIMRNYGEKTGSGGETVYQRSWTGSRSGSQRLARYDSSRIRQVVAEDGSIVFTNSPENYAR
ncbi:MAG: lytic transglycosylase domain-containing protein [Nitrospirota bacterium]|nr:lytic transglycosylase domain-containing protein [Nitrospirota bacterium]